MSIYKWWTGLKESRNKDMRISVQSRELNLIDMGLKFDIM